MTRPGHVRGGDWEYPPRGENRAAEVERIGDNGGADTRYGTGGEANRGRYFHVVSVGVFPAKILRRVPIDPKFGHAVSHPEIRCGDVSAE